ncbi:MAG TPA: hypothetical protein PKK69_06475 [Ferruginibacter sp.]|nr:hypothetical protein [Ferruginibacter sp.]
MAGIILGAIGGWMYWYWVGCASGTCRITSKPLNSTIYGSLLGFLLLGLFQSDDSKSKKQTS